MSLAALVGELVRLVMAFVLLGVLGSIAVAIADEIKEWKT